MSEPEPTRQITLLDEWGYPYAAATIPLADWGCQSVSWNGQVYLLVGVGHGDGNPWYRPIQPVAVEATELRPYSAPPEVP